MLDFDRAAAAEYARLAAILRRSGNRIGERDLMIAATALAHARPIATLNRAEFERIPDLEIADLPLPTSE
ncbi:MAG TPA: type II toxin-antitoxin system VapC family toxin [Tepidiformaceae bacterium]|nr:type II toxin-antitoxin system VapC family toxin [Tepidiformaceae bacterium]